MNIRKDSVKVKSRSAASADVKTLPVHDIQGAVVFHLSQAFQTILGVTRFEEVCDDLHSREFTLICRDTDQIVYVHLTPVVEPRDLVRSPTPPTPEVLPTAKRKVVRKSPANKS